tara:strand:+ start:485 stop:931 length:447 start_codon:yes stop_codon:yes gene_type:complete
MIILSDKLYAIKSHHKYNTRLKTSTWTGLNAAGKVQGSELDKLRNNLDNVDWADLFLAVEDNKMHLPNKQRNEWEKSLLNLLRMTDLRLNPRDAITVDGEFKDYILNKQRDYKKLQKALWQVLMGGMECLEFINWDVETNKDSLWETE